MSRSRPADDGSILPLVCGLVVLVVALIAVAVDVSALHLRRRELDALADSAALGAARAVDLDAFYAGEWADAVPLDPVAARLEVAHVLADADRGGSFESVALESVTVDGATVTVVLTARVRAPVRGLLGQEWVDVASSASATTPLL